MKETQSARDWRQPLPRHRSRAMLCDVSRGARDIHAISLELVQDHTSVQQRLMSQNASSALERLS